MCVRTTILTSSSCWWPILLNSTPRLSDLLAAALMPTSKHIHKLYEDLFGLTQKEIALLPDDVSRRRTLRKPTYEVAAGLLQFFGARKISDLTPGEKSSKVYREDVKIDGALVELIKKGCDYDAMQWLIDKQLLCSELVYSPTDLLRRLLSARPLPKKGGAEPFFIIGYRQVE
ncbi:hypothetical protein Pelo_13814 [Pelomyxa schiedti]|nr:hypothetical protein Pelo_13814 [Pelomyxa schiedti]